MFPRLRVSKVFKEFRVQFYLRIQVVILWVQSLEKLYKELMVESEAPPDTKILIEGEYPMGI